MLEDKKFFQIFWRLIRFFGLQPQSLNKVEKFRAIFIFLFLFVTNIGLLVMEIFKTTSAETIIKVIQTFPTIIIILADSLSFMRKSDSIEKLFNDLNTIVKESGDEKLFNDLYKKTMVVVKALAVFSIVAILLSTVQFMATGKTEIPIYVPVDNGPIFITIWVVQSLFMIYIATIVWLLDSFVFVSFSILTGYTKVLSKQFREILHDNGSFVKCHQDHLKFKR
jgi:7tm Odorant receptor